jgi:peptidoglycan/LPS O-acetylase OafA/YrhL
MRVLEGVGGGSAMATMSEPHNKQRNVAGRLSTIFGGLALVSVGWLALLTYAIDPPNWIRIVGASLLPIGIVAGLLAGLVGRRGPGRAWALAGLTLVALAVISFVVLLASVDY